MVLTQSYCCGSFGCLDLTDSSGRYGFASDSLFGVVKDPTWVPFGICTSQNSAQLFHLDTVETCTVPINCNQEGGIVLITGLTNSLSAHLIVFDLIVYICLEVMPE